MEAKTWRSSSIRRSDALWFMPFSRTPRPPIRGSILFLPVARCAEGAGGDAAATLRDLKRTAAATPLGPIRTSCRQISTLRVEAGQRAGCGISRAWAVRAGQKRRDFPIRAAPTFFVPRIGTISGKYTTDSGGLSTFIGEYNPSRLRTMIQRGRFSLILCSHIPGYGRGGGPEPERRCPRSNQDPGQGCSLKSMGNLCWINVCGTFCAGSPR